MAKVRIVWIALSAVFNLAELASVSWSIPIVAFLTLSTHPINAIRVIEKHLRLCIPGDLAIVNSRDTALAVKVDH